MDELEVMKCGTEVVIGKDIDGLVTAICIREASRVTYEVSWWNGRSHVCKWFEPFEVRAKSNKSKPVQIGFAQ